MFTLYQEQILNISISEAWDYFSSPRNLKDITPSYMGFDIYTEIEGKMYAGQIIEYRVRPILNIPMKWVTEISHVNEPYFFVDNQIVGPYKVWHHQHKFTKLSENKVKMIDIVNYLPPIPILNNILNELFIKNKLKQIFDYRREYLEKKFNQ